MHEGAHSGLVGDFSSAEQKSVAHVSLAVLTCPGEPSGAPRRRRSQSTAGSTLSSRTPPCSAPRYFAVERRYHSQPSVNRQSLLPRNKLPRAPGVSSSVWGGRATDPTEVDQKVRLSRNTRARAASSSLIRMPRTEGVAHGSGCTASSFNLGRLVVRDSPLAETAQTTQGGAV